MNRRTVYLAIVGIDAVGVGLFLPMSVLYFTVSVGLAPARVGLVLTLAALVGLASGPLAGPLLERLGAERLITLSYAVRMVAFGSYLVVDTVPEFAVAASAAYVAMQMARPAQLVLADTMAGDRGRVRLLAVVRSLRNVGMAVGSALAGVILAVTAASYTAVLIADVSTVVVATALAVAFLATAPRRTPAAATDPTAPGASFRDVLADRRYLTMTAVVSLLCWHTPIMVVGMAMWLDAVAVRPGQLMAVVLTVNTVLVALLQVRFSRGAHEPAGAASALRRGAGLLAAGCLVLPSLRWVGDAPGLVAAVVVVAVLLVTAAELLVSAGSWGLAFGLAPAGRAERHLAVYSLGESIATAAAPAVISGLVVHLHALTWVVLGAAYLAILALVARFDVGARPAVTAATGETP